jgi:hypothetical protein
MAFSGRFVLTATNNDNYESRNNWGTGVDPGHSDGAMGTDQGFPALTNPYVPSTPDNVLDSYDPSGVNASPNMLPADREPSGHAGTGSPSRTSNKYDEIASDTRRHEENYGATLKGTEPMVMRSVTQTFGSPLIESLPTATDDASASATGEARRVLRGFNSFAQNNPGSPTENYSGNYIRRGKQLFRFTDRRMERRGLTHEKRPVYLNVATTARVTNGPQGVNYSPYGSPFTSVAKLTSGPARPMARREPRQWDETAVTDGSESGYASDAYQYGPWGGL